MPAGFWWDIIKLCLQFAGALIIARLTVLWALGRFKTEKSWERRIASLAAVMAAIREMYRIQSIWYDDEIAPKNYTDGYRDDLADRYRLARKKFEDVAAVAILVLPENIASIILKLETDLADGRYDTSFERHDTESFLINEALKSLTKAVKDVV